MTDNEKNMALLIKWCNEKCEGCKERCDDCSVDAVKQLLVYAHNQKAEIERLGKILENRGEICKSCDEKYTEKIKRAKAKAVKEFWEKIKKYFKKNICFFTPEDESELIQYGDNLVKEMVGD